MADPLSKTAVEHVAKLARLRLDEQQLAAYRTQLASVLQHIATLEELDVDVVEPMAHPLDVTNRTADDVVSPPMDLDALLANAPATEGGYLAVPKVLEDQGG
ncbi:MAG: Asp-tRNA(Asn)/Glu-tRNA(Gln) amidotransferase subunit GatC [Phycisphaerales bacterium]|nr:Asp-tRNA(Asn)/Glu-tRNA(Gln) amidotransferase subunit GatC [Phycisphaerae bacterium]NNF41580.1 Asp-tRNA(Asn)/Glu-tRNA(Gln) amidotransferase subunit GatC [Phycisphaerales bacterium]NNM24519.1 Asp-tRNA(Asn)/Glu-tRNA(Gln) amidotransferase subunit GatC [Phycisphaerales bacterium]